MAIYGDIAKLYSLMPAKDAIHILRDPISNIKALCNLTQQKYNVTNYDFKKNNEIKVIKEKTNTFAFCFTPDRDPKEILKDLYFFITGDGENGFDKMPNANACNSWMSDTHQAFHDGILESVLIRIDNIIELQTSDFIAEAGLKTLGFLAKKFGFNEPKKEDE